jgi:hypothetical protein
MCGDLSEHPQRFSIFHPPAAPGDLLTPETFEYDVSTCTGRPTNPAHSCVAFEKLEAPSAIPWFHNVLLFQPYRQRQYVAQHCRLEIPACSQMGLFLFDSLAISLVAGM